MGKYGRGLFAMLRMLCEFEISLYEVNADVLYGVFTAVLSVEL